MAELPLEKLRSMAEMAIDLTSEARNSAEQCRDYYDGHQYTAQEIAEYKRRRQPVITTNRIQRKVDAMVGLEQRSRTDPKAVPRNPQDEKAAEVATQALTFIEDLTRFDQKTSMAFENLLVEGFGGVEVIVESKRSKLDPVINRIRWEELFYDPHSREKDFSDAAFMGSMKWMNIDAALEMYGSAYKGDDLEQILEASMHPASDGQTYEDRPYKVTFWTDAASKRVRIAQMYYKRKGMWYLAVFCGGGEILNAPSPYLDEDGAPTNPMVLMTAYVDRENRRYGLVRPMLSMQDEVNHRRSKGLHQLNARQTQTVKGAVSVEALKRELAKPDGNVELDIDAIQGAREAGVPAFQILPTQDQAAGNLQLLQEAKNEIDMLGPNASLIGQLQGEQSGRAIMAQQQAGMAELSPIYDSLRDWKIRVYRQIWMRIRQYWTDERWIRVTDESQAPEWIGINRVSGQQIVMGPNGIQQIAPILDNQVSQMDVDIIIEESPDYVSLRYEEFEQLNGMAERGMPIPPEMIIEASSLRNKGKILKMLKEREEEALRAQAAGQEALAKAEADKATVSAISAQARAERDTAEARQTDTETDNMLLQRRISLGI